MRPALKIIFILSFCLFLFPHLGYSQKKTGRPVYNNRAPIPKKQKTYQYIIVGDTRNILYGNKCATLVTRRFGFEYLPIPKNQLVTERESSLMFHNLFTNLTITLRKGIFWKLALKHRIKQCQRQSQDMNG